MKNEFTITVYSENKTGILSRVIGIITRRHINIESLSASKSSISGIHRITITILETDELVRKVVAQIDKQIDVLKSFYYKNEDLVFQEIALYKIPSEGFFNGEQLERMIRKHNARILTIESEYIVIEKTGHKEETEALLTELKKTGIYEFVRSGKVAIVKPMERLNKYLKQVDEKSFN
jgi:acetolactate synthase-1/3 small subunit